MNGEWSITSPLALLDEWRGPAERGALHDFLLLGFTVNLPFLEKAAIRTARDLGARVTVVGDAAQSHFDPVDVRLRSYITGWAACQGAFHPKLALLAGENDISVAIGSGNPTLAGWAGNDELWTVLRHGPDGTASGLRELGDWLGELPDVAAMPAYTAEVLREVAARLTAFPGHDGDARVVKVLNNLRHGLLSQLPQGPVRELRMYAPFVDMSGPALAEIIRQFDPEHIVMGLQEHWTRYDGDAVLRATGNRTIEVRLLPEGHYRHGKLLEWDTGDGRFALTGSANLTRAALLDATADGGNCELAVLAPVEKPLMPKDGTVVAATQLQGRRTSSAMTPRPVVLLLGALLTGGGLLVTLARKYDTEVTVETSPDGAPGSWSVLGTVEAGKTEMLLPVAGTVGTVVRAVVSWPGEPRAESPPVFAVNPARCARRQEDDRRPRLRYSYSEEEIFTDEEMARQFRNDYFRLVEGSVQYLRSGRASGGGSHPPVKPNAEDQWAAYLEDCERSIGRPLTVTLFGPLAQLIPGLSHGQGWGIADDSPAEGDIDDDDGDEPGVEVPISVPRISPSERATWCRWIRRLALAATADGDGQPPVPLFLKSLASRLMIQLLAHGIWDSDDETWRELLALLAVCQVPDHTADDEPVQARQRAAALVAACMGLLRVGASMVGGTPRDLLAAEVWKTVRPVVADANPDLADDLLFAPVHARAVILNRSELEDTIRLAKDAPVAALVSGFAKRGWDVEHDGQIYRVTGVVTDPVAVAAQVATRLGEFQDIALVHACGVRGWAFIAWHRPRLLLAYEPGRMWRMYRIDGFATPESRFAPGGGIPTANVVGRPVRFGQNPSAEVLAFLAEAGTNPAALLSRLMDVPKH